MILQAILNIAEICARKNLQHLILSPGSRVAPLTIAFNQHPDIQTITISDERSAAFTALGLANQFVQDFVANTVPKLNLVGIACTSGSAAYNYAPAVVEAFYQQIPLLIFTADRPPEWIDQLDGQTIRQREIYGKHVKASYELPTDYTHPDSVWHIQRIVNEAINLTQALPYGPVHINVPLREPFYPQVNEKIHFDKSIKIIEVFDNQSIINNSAWAEILSIWESAERKLIVAGQNYLEPALLKSLQNIYQDFRVPIVGDIIANLPNQEGSIQYHDTFLMNNDEILKENLQPELLITFGKSLISKNLKLFLRKYKPKYHWHIQAAGIPADTFQTLTHLIPMQATHFFEKLYNDLDFQTMLERDEEGEDNEYNALWQKLNQQAAKTIHQFVYASKSLNFSDLAIMGELLEYLPAQSILHLANSMSVRYANFFGLNSQNTGIQVFANRGTSGIDGSTGTAVGSAMGAKNKILTLITGDLAFFYDRNSLWNNYLPHNLRIIILNNQSGNIFRIIEGPSQQPELEEYFETYHQLNAENTAKDFDLMYSFADNWLDLEKCLKNFFEPALKSKILEIRTDKKINAEVFNQFKIAGKAIKI